MSFSVPKEILNATTKCVHSFSCLDSGKCGERKMCEVTYAVKPYLLDLKSKEYEDCAYRVSYGFTHYCSCPTHFTIYQMQNS
jgi:hypothetical protein